MRTGSDTSAASGGAKQTVPHNSGRPFKLTWKPVQVEPASSVPSGVEPSEVEDELPEMYEPEPSSVPSGVEPSEVEDELPEMYKEDSDDEPGQHRRRRIANKKTSTPTPELQDDQMSPLQDSDDEDDVMEEPPRSSPRLHPGRGQARRAVQGVTTQVVTTQVVTTDNAPRAELRDKACDILRDMEAKLKRQEKLEQAAAKRRAQTVQEEEVYKRRYPYESWVAPTCTASTPTRYTYTRPRRSHEVPTEV
jgi:hypothetical protein